MNKNTSSDKPNIMSESSKVLNPSGRRTRKRFSVIREEKKILKQQKKILGHEIELFNEGLIKRGREGIRGLDAVLLWLNKEWLMGLVKLFRELALYSTLRQNYDHDEERRL
jgi:hypothetical protein